MKIWIIGADGQLGCELVRRLIGHEGVLATGRAEADITNRTVLMNAAMCFRPDVVINCAAWTDVDAAEHHREQVFAINALGAGYVAEAAQRVGASLLHVSSDYVFDGQSAVPYRESDPPNPINVYGKSKLAGEQAVFSMCAKTLVIRTSWVFGGNGRHFVRSIVAAAKKHDRIDVVENYFGTPTYIGDVAKVLLQLARCMMTEKVRFAYGLYHFAGVPFVSRIEFARVILRQAAQQHILDAMPEIYAVSAQDYVPVVAPRPLQSRLNCRKIQHTFGIVPSDWQYALTSLVDYS